jgi:hypothetical protein
MSWWWAILAAWLSFDLGFFAGMWFLSQMRKATEDPEDIAWREEWNARKKSETA